MPRFTQADEAFLKRTMLPRGPDYFYKPEDVEFIMKETGQGKEDIQYWARQLRWKMSINKLPGGLDVEEFLKSSPESLSDKVEKILVKRCYVSMFNADQNLVTNFSIPKPRGPGDFSIQFLCFAWNPETFVSEAFIELNEQVHTTVIHDRLKELGASSINIMTFQHNDNNHSAASALNRVISTAKSEGFREVVRGNCNPKLASKLDEIQAKERAEKQARNAEFDEKTQAAIKMSLGEIKDSMATKNEISHLEEVTQTKSDEIKSSFVEMKEAIKVDYKETITRQAVTITDQTDIITSLRDANAKLNEAIINNDRKMMNLENRNESLENRNESQRYIIAKLNAEMKHKEQQIAERNAIIEAKNQTILRLTDQGTSTECKAVIDQMKEVLAEFQACKKRKHDA